MFLYAKREIQWTTGDRSGGYNGLGTRGIEAVAGIDNGAGITIPGSLSTSIKDIAQTTNTGHPGIWLFKVGQGT